MKATEAKELSIKTLSETKETALEKIYTSIKEAALQGKTKARYRATLHPAALKELTDNGYKIESFDEDYFSISW